MGKVLRFRKSKKKKKNKRPQQQPSRQQRVWQVGAFRMPMWVQDDDEHVPYRPFGALALSLDMDLVSGSDLATPDSYDTGKTVIEALFKLNELCGYWPDSLEISDLDLVETLKSTPENSGDCARPDRSCGPCSVSPRPCGTPAIEARPWTSFVN